MRRGAFGPDPATAHRGDFVNRPERLLVGLVVAGRIVEATWLDPQRSPAGTTPSLPSDPTGGDGRWRVSRRWCLIDAVSGAGLAN